MLYDLEQAFEKIFGCQKNSKLRNSISDTRPQQNGHFYKFYPFSAFSVLIHRISDEFHATILEKIKKEIAPFSVFNPIFGHQEASDKNFDHSIFLVRSSLVGTQSFINLKCPVYGAPSARLSLGTQLSELLTRSQGE